MEDSLKPVPGSLSSISSNLTLIARASTFNFFSSQDSFPELLERQLRSAGLHAARGASAPTTVISWRGAYSPKSILSPSSSRIPVSFHLPPPPPPDIVSNTHPVCLQWSMRWSHGLSNTQICLRREDMSYGKDTGNEKTNTTKHGESNESEWQGSVGGGGASGVKTLQRASENRSRVCSLEPANWAGMSDSGRRYRYCVWVDVVPPLPCGWLWTKGQTLFPLIRLMEWETGGWLKEMGSDRQEEGPPAGGGVKRERLRGGGGGGSRLEEHRVMEEKALGSSCQIH